jgi:hypothetical protein
MNWSYRIEPSSSEVLANPFYGFKFYKTLTDDTGAVILDQEISAEEFKDLADPVLVSGFRVFALDYLKKQLEKMLTPLDETGNLPTNIAPYSFGIAADKTVDSVRTFLE